MIIRVNVTVVTIELIMSFSGVFEHIKIIKDRC